MLQQGTCGSSARAPRGPVAWSQVRRAAPAPSTPGRVFIANCTAAPSALRTGGTRTVWSWRRLARAFGPAAGRVSGSTPAVRCARWRRCRLRQWTGWSGAWGLPGWSGWGGGAGSGSLLPRARPHARPLPVSSTFPPALARLCSYLEWRKEQEPARPATLPGRLLALQRPPQLPPAGSKKDGGGEAERWSASWLGGEALATGGVRFSRHVVADHWVSALVGLLGVLASADAVGAGGHSMPGGGEAEEGEAGSKVDARSA